MNFFFRLSVEGQKSLRFPFKTSSFLFWRKTSNGFGATQVCFGPRPWMVHNILSSEVPQRCCLVLMHHLLFPYWFSFSQQSFCCSRGKMRFLIALSLKGILYLFCMPLCLCSCQRTTTMPEEGPCSPRIKMFGTTLSLHCVWRKVCRKMYLD